MKRLSGSALREATKERCRGEFLKLQAEYGVANPKAWEATQLWTFRLRLRDIQTEIEAVKLWKKLRPLLRATRDTLVEPIAIAQRAESRLKDQLSRELDKERKKQLREEIRHATNAISDAVRGQRCASWLRRLVMPILPGWDWHAPEDGRSALIEQFKNYNMLDLPPANDKRGGSQALRARDLAIIALLIEAWWPIKKTAYDIPSGVIDKEAARIANLLTKIDDDVRRGPRFNPSQ